ncbi:MAG: circularly permuted type 2 ATP-grasp protein, partial [Planctomycetota bacterium]
DEQCDPVELAPNAKHGVAGLVESVRTGSVALANPLGSRLMESPAWLPFLPAICQRLLSEELLLPSVATWWCGQESAQRYVMEHLDELVVRPAFRVGSGLAVLPRNLSRQRRDELCAAIRREPGKYVAQQQTPRSTAPAWTGAGVEPWHLDLRMFAVGLQKKFSAMPGGLARASANADELEYVIRAGQRSHDVWVLGDEPAAKISLLTPQSKPVVLKRSGSELPSRVADNLFWLGRHVERADGAGRLLRTVLWRLASDEENDPTELTALLRLLAEQGQVEPAFIVEGMQQSLPQIEVALPAAVFNEQEPTSLRSTVNQIVHLSTVVRDRLSLDVWRIVLQINEHCRQPSVDQGRIDATDVLEVIEHLIADLSAFAGLVAERMTRTLGWRFLELGRRIEAALIVAGLLRGTICRRHGDEQRILESVLTIDDSVMTYRSRYLADLREEPLVDLLLVDETNPRSIGFQLAAIR